MIREVAAPYFGVIILEDTDTGEYYFQCLCGQIGLYEQCIKMNESEKLLFTSGNLDLSDMMRNICQKLPGYKERITATPK